MRYMIRLVYHCKRSKVLDVIAGLKGVDHAYVSYGFNTNGKIYVDRTGPMDTAVYQFEVDSLDTFFAWQRGIYANPPAEALPVIACLNDNAVEGFREIYEVIV
ncbi:MAG: hypothetical protein FJZ47_13250 [Candidatus Tectomicrobia bacterium]|uniref:Uncharacterized protein n=1 Tax=Tectimicrobiota bacterium TaxID=2528274 RepID=A0A937W3Z8_UNCTE|nr:hypothetical protein [Candidatus Tectomicrobia bacterium]